MDASEQPLKRLNSREGEIVMVGGVPVAVAIARDKRVTLLVGVEAAELHKAAVTLRDQYDAQAKEKRRKRRAAQTWKPQVRED